MSTMSKNFVLNLKRHDLSAHSILVQPKTRTNIMKKTKQTGLCGLVACQKRMYETRAIILHIYTTTVFGEAK